MKGALAQENAQENAQKRHEELSDEEKIIVLIRNDPQMTRNELAVKLNISPGAVKKGWINLRRLEESNIGVRQKQQVGCAETMISMPRW